MKLEPKQHLRNAGLMWSLIGLFLASMGTAFIFGNAPVATIWMWALLAFIIGVIKAQTVLRIAARKTIVRIKAFTQPESFFKVFKPVQWLVVALMMSIGFIVRGLGVPKQWRGCVLLAVGVGLLWASRYFWKAYCETCQDRQCA